LAVVRLECFLAKWSWFNLIVFVVVVSSISFFFNIAAHGKSEIVLTIPRNGFSIGSNVVLALLASLVPGVVVLAWSKECRAALLRVGAGIHIYLLALLIGFVLPFLSYLGARHAYPLPWNSNTPVVLIRVFFINLLLTPLWEEVIWRGFFYPKVSSMIGLPRAIFVTAVGWMIWHAGFIFLLYRSGIAPPLLLVFSAQVFFGGVALCSIFTLGGNSLAPCVLLHCSLNASTVAYYGSYGRVSDLGSYIAEALATLLVSAILFSLVMCKGDEALVHCARPRLTDARAAADCESASAPPAGNRVTETF
jgi:membrane protease YdiL (CAAX protease family)